MLYTVKVYNQVNNVIYAKATFDRAVAKAIYENAGSRNKAVGRAELYLNGRLFATRYIHKYNIRDVL
jgi:hypothetical protein